MRPVYILSAMRTPIGKYGGSLCSLSASDMGMVAARAALEWAAIAPEEVDEVIFGHARETARTLDGKLRCAPESPRVFRLIP